ncbi:helix-turn-helix domain-containing protein [Halobacteria archaeon AArc-m2/3/4]|uniref:Helix-turn-helix domain-containing protein n=1 Tax=Natronoglomus mannanivorans TaxID=2979990 RepID=A0ABT2QIQ2_9EURY|nr:helix-turn-helix domain-containing protein [Halobacteria archaeon AArc-m2/3/4]
MSFIAEWTHELHVLEHTFERLPDLKLSLEEIHQSGSEESENVFYHWASGVDFEAFEAAMDADPHCDTLAPISTVGDRRLYRITASEDGQREILYPVVAESDMVILDSTLTREGLESRVRVPSRAALVTFKEACQNKSLWFSLNRLYREQPGRRDYGVTDAQREALLAALDAGYFAVPRETTLQELASTFGVSDQALSARLRRGQAHLLRQTLAAAEHGT